MIYVLKDRSDLDQYIGDISNIGTDLLSNIENYIDIIESEDMQDTKIIISNNVDETYNEVKNSFPLYKNFIEIAQNCDETEEEEVYDGYRLHIFTFSDGNGIIVYQCYF